MNIIQSVNRNFPGIIENASKAIKRTVASTDDIIDAVILAVMACKKNQLTRIPELPDYDKEGFVREIVF